MVKKLQVADQQTVTSALTAMETDDENKMDVDQQQADLNSSWAQVASFAMHKLLSSWDDGANLAERVGILMEKVGICVSC